MLILLCLVALVVGTLTGSVGIGGILLIPALNTLGGLSVHMSMGTALLSFFFIGLLATWLYQRHGSIDWGLTLPVCLGALMSGYAGAWTNNLVPAHWLNLMLGCVIVFAGIYTFLPSKRRPRSSTEGRNLPLLLGIGLIVGFGSGLTGVGGAVLSVPLMVILGFHPLTSIAVGQVLQIPASLSASLGNAANGSLDFQMAALVTVMELVGVVAGVRLAHSMSTHTLKTAVAVVCMIVGSIVLLRALMTW